MSDAEIISHLQAQNASQAQQIIMLEEKVVLLLELFQKEHIQKDSHNSSLPPSRDLVSKNKSLRIPSSRKSGGRPGHPGTILEMSSTPDKITEVKSGFCSYCGQSLSEATFVLLSYQILN